jgi:hypothetical protein
MMEHNIGALPVLRNGEIAGIFSERDVMYRVVAAGRMPGTTKVSEVMTANPKAISVDETIENCLFLMREFGFRHLPITDGKQLKGLVSLRDPSLRVAKAEDGGPPVKGDRQGTKGRAASFWPRSDSRDRLLVLRRRRIRSPSLGGSQNGNSTTRLPKTRSTSSSCFSKSIHLLWGQIAPSH